MKIRLLQTVPILTLIACVVHAGQPRVEITKNCPELRYLGRPATFEIAVANRGDGPALNVVVRDTVSGGVTFLSADSGGIRENADVVWQLGTLAPGQTRTLTTTMRCDRIGQVANTARVSYCAEAETACAFDIKGIPAILLECVDDPDPTEVGAELTYTITVLNQGSAVGTNILVNCTLAPEQEYVSSTGPSKAAVAGKSVRFAPLASLAPKQKAVFSLRVKALAPGDVRFAVELNSDQITRPVMETESSYLY